MRWMGDYHALLRAALRIKRRVRRRAALDDAAADALAQEVTSTARTAGLLSGLMVDRAFVRAVEQPPGGRLNQVVFERLSAVHGVPAETIASALFARRRGHGSS